MTDEIPTRFIEPVGELSQDQRLRVAALNAAVAYHNHQFVRPSSVGATTQEFYDFLKGESHGKR